MKVVKEDLEADKIPVGPDIKFLPYPLDAMIISVHSFLFRDVMHHQLPVSEFYSFNNPR